MVSHHALAPEQHRPIAIGWTQVGKVGHTYVRMNIKSAVVVQADLSKELYAENRVNEVHQE